MNNVSRFIIIVYAFLFVLAGILETKNTGSTSSFYFGVTTASIFLLTLIIFKDKPNQGYLYIASVTLILSILFLNNYSKEFIFYPSGVMFMASITSFIITGLSWLRDKKSGKF